MNNELLKNYAKLFVQVGGNVQRGQTVVISCPIACAHFGRMVQDEAYDAGASEVLIDWVDDLSYRIWFLRSSDTVFSTYPQWKVDKLKDQDKKDAVYLQIDSSDPELLKDINLERIKKYRKASRGATKEHSRNLMTNAQRWSIIAIPSTSWAKKVFPHLAEEEAVENLWNLIIKAARADSDDPVADWIKHRNILAKRIEYLNNADFSKLRFSTGLGTDFTVGLVQNHIWVGGNVLDKHGTPFFPNMPTEEIFTMPDRNSCDGRVVASMPMFYSGNLIEDFEFTFKSGSVEKYDARIGKESLASILEIDEGASQLGEVALVPNSSPIGQMKTMFYNLLFDENAASHLALGKSYPFSVTGGEKLNDEELKALGGNYSLTHIDFMFGTSDMRVAGLKHDGSETVIMENGEFVI
ncbi:MAG: aminopeptidase [Oscillospiraceae bacterium]|nr:aminopeptidase [Oscillospiraceae bacterium]MCL2277951.1 aminopeptidase [Oscillospiraceae bacterium]